MERLTVVLMHPCLSHTLKYRMKDLWKLQAEHQAVELLIKNREA